MLAPVQSRALQIARTPTTFKTSQPQLAPFEKRPFAERKAALNLAQLAQSDATLNPDKVKNLIGTLIVSFCHWSLEARADLLFNQAEAPAGVDTLYDSGAAADPVPSEQEKRDLHALIDLARRRLDGSS